jgi:ubiquinone/menaquinone biosynthesis C-methylase UbiE
MTSDDASSNEAIDLNPQARQMADESMVRTLAAQARAIWPQEIPLLRRYAIPERAQILDAGCGTGEASSRLAEFFPAASVLGVDIIDAHLDRARARYAALAPRLRFEHQSVYDLACEDDTFDLTVCRHVIHAIPQAARVLGELVRVTRPGGMLHVIAEDYGMLHFQQAVLDPMRFWDIVPAAVSRATRTDLFAGRNAFGIFAALGLEQIAMEYIVVDTLRVDRNTFATILTAWRDGYAGIIAENTTFSADDAAAYFDQMIADVRDPGRYAVWMVPVLSGRVPA